MYKIFLFRDNVPAVLLASWNLDAAMFEGDKVAGPVMTLFAEDVEATTTAMMVATFEKNMYIYILTVLIMVLLSRNNMSTMLLAPWNLDVLFERNCRPSKDPICRDTVATSAAIR